MKKRGISIIVAVAIALFTTPIYSFAGTRVVDQGVIEESNLQYRHTETVTNKWTEYKYITGAWVRLNKGDSLYATDASGNNVTVSIGAGYGALSVGVSVPLRQENGQEQFNVFQSSEI